MHCAQAQDIQRMHDIGPVQATIQATVGQLPVQIFRLRLRPGAPACLRLLAGHPWVAQASPAITGQRIAVRTMRKGVAVVKRACKFDTVGCMWDEARSRRRACFAGQWGRDHADSSGTRTGPCTGCANQWRHLAALPGKFEHGPAQPFSCAVSATHKRDMLRCVHVQVQAFDAWGHPTAPSAELPFLLSVSSSALVPHSATFPFNGKGCACPEGNDCISLCCFCWSTQRSI